MPQESDVRYEPKELIEYIQSLRESTDDKQTSLLNYLKYSALLVKSPFALVLKEGNKKDWNLLGSYAFENVKEQEDEVIQLALGMYARVVKKGFAYERVTIESCNITNQMAFAVKIDKGIEGAASFLFFVVEYQDSKQLSEMIIRTLMNTDIPHLLFNKEVTSKTENVPALSDEKLNTLNIEVLDILSQIIFQEKFLLASMFLVNEIATRFNCSQVSLGWEKGAYVNPVAISHIEKFDKNMETVQDLQALYEEAADQDEEIIYPVHEISDSIVFAHHHYVDKTKATEVFSVPFRTNDRVVGVMTCEKINGSFSEEELILLRLLSNYITPWLKEIHDKDRWIGARVLSKSRQSLGKFFSLKNTFLKFSAVLVSAFIIYALLGTWNYKVEVVSSLETDNVAFVSAPFNGLVYKVDVHVGDKVQKGDKLLSFDKDELYLKEAEALADINKYKSESEKARAKNSLADMRVALSKKKESELNLERVHYYLKKSDMFSSLEGVIIAGDKEELLGAPVSKGDVLFKVTQSTELYLKLQIPERYLDEVNSTLGGEFVLLSSPDKKYHFQIDNIIPMASVDQSEGNVFVGRAKVIGIPEDWWRPGMSGVSKIEVGEKNIAWILTHDFVEFIRIYFWI
ncbi:MAG: Unknown protein [uncultured Sulfurovum sp.]|uniref:Uncharacterized protein n=1 Tax=uncultured Sulfurovum sp. TaxID=269237 RepID=A0A6S6S0V1_9BACT|nr:MAG: Unknown protein [uncultured Sulfurovum sp.]